MGGRTWWWWCLLGAAGCDWAPFGGGDPEADGRDADAHVDVDAGADAAVEPDASEPACTGETVGYRDRDGDGFGGAALCAEEPDMVQADGDCDDGDAAVNPDGTDEPDAAFVDADCDGIDGDPSRMLFVALDGS